MSNKRLHIILCLELGGTEQALYHLITYHADSSHPETIIVLKDLGYYGDLLRTQGFDIHALNIQKNLLALFQLPFLLRKIDPDVICSWSYYTDLLMLLFGRICTRAKIVWNIRRSIFIKEKEPLYRRIVRKLLAFLSWAPHLIVFNSHTGEKTHLAYGFRPRTSTVISNGVDIKRFTVDHDARSHTRKQLGVHEQEILLGCVARYNPVKGHMYLIQAMEHLTDIPHLRLCLIGKDIPALLSSSQSNTAFSNIILLPAIECIEKYYNAFDLHVLPSLSEGFPNAVAESMACGIPNISTDVGDTSRIIGDTGILVPSENADALRNAIRDMSTLSTEERLQKGMQARERIEQYYSLDRFVQSYDQTLKLL